MPTRTLAFALLVAAAACGGGSSSSQQQPPPTPSQLGFAVQPGAAISTAAITPTVKVEIRDASGARVPGSTAAVTLAIGAGTAGATLAGTTTVAAVDGVATFPGLSVDLAGTGYRLHASAPGLAAADSTPFDVAVGSPAKLVFSLQPSNGRCTVALAPAVVVDVVDAGGNLVTAATNAVSLVIATGPAVARLTGTTSAAAAAGRATFGAAAVDLPGVYTLRAASAGLADALSASFIATSAWMAVGPDGGYVGKIAVHPTTPSTLLAAAGAAGLWRSTDAAATWTPVPLPGRAGVDGVRFVPGPAAEAWAWGSAGVWHSTDGGTTWVAASPPLVTFGPVVPGPGAGELFTSGWNGSAFALLRSADDGATWANVSPALPGGVSPWTLGVSADGALWVDTSAGVYRLPSGGGAWSAAGTGPGGTAPGYFYAFAFHPTDPLKAWAGVYSNALATADGGATWTPQVLNGSTVFDLLVDGSTAAPPLYAATYGSGVWRSPDGGATWAATGAMTIWSANALAGSGAAVYAGTESGVWKTADTGATWTRASAGLRAATPTALAFQPGATGLVLAGGSGEVFRSTDGGATWSRAQVAPGDVHHRIAFDPAAPAVVFSATDYHGLLRSTDAGLSWTAATGTAGRVLDVAVGGGTPSVVWALTSAGVYRSVDGGATFAKAWNLAATSSANALAADPASGLVAWAGVEDSTTASASGVYRTADGGATWTQFPGSPAVGANSRLEVVAANTSVLWLETGGSPYRSTDGGSTWTSVYPAAAGSQLWGMGIDPSDPLRCFIGSSASGAYLTTDGGATWTQVLRGLPPEVDRVVVDPAAPLSVWSLGAGLYRSTTGGL